MSLYLLKFKKNINIHKSYSSIIKDHIYQILLIKIYGKSEQKFLQNNLLKTIKPTTITKKKNEPYTIAKLI